VDDRSVFCYRGKEFRFNDHVYGELLMVPEDKRSGRLVQVRKGCGQFGSNVYFIRLRDGTLMTWENAMLRKVDDQDFIKAFYRVNGNTPPEVLPQEINENDSECVEYTIKGEYPETGFVIESPSQPQKQGSFSLAITTDIKEH